MKPLTNLIAISILLFSLNGCTEEQPFDFVLPLDIDPVFRISDDDGVWSESEIITYNDVADAIDDLSEDITFSDISIEGVTLIVDDQAAALSGVENVLLELVDSQGQETVIFNNVSIPIPAGQGRVEVVVTDLAHEGVLALKELLEGYALNESFEDFALVTSGRSAPQGTPLNMELTVVLHMSFNYSEDLEVPYFMGND